MEYECEICKDTEFILEINKDGIEIAKECGCRAKKIAKRQFRNSGISEEYQKKGFNDFLDRGIPQLVTAKQRTINYYRNYSENEHLRNNSILFCGQVGCGKTHLGIATCNNLLQNNNVCVVYMAYRNVVTKIKQSITDKEKYNRELERYMKARLLYIDDMLKGKVNESDVNIMYEIINYRYMNNLPVIISTEKTPNELLEFDEATGSRILEMCKQNIIVFTGTDLNYRLISEKQEKKPFRSGNFE